jgi:uncharacterized membrane protein YfcA
VNLLHALPPADMGVLALGLVIAGVVGGLVSGVLGIGGGIVVVPVLYHVLATLGLDESVRMHVAVGTSLAAGIPAALSGAQSSVRSADRYLMREWIAPALVGVALGSWLMAISSGRILALVFATSAALVVLSVALGRGDTTAVVRSPRLLDRFALPLTLGVAAAMTGMGGKTVAIPAANLRVSSRAQTAQTASIFAAAIVVPASIGAVLAGWNANALPPDSLGYVNLLGFALIAPILLLMEPAGDALAHWIDVKRLRVVFAALIIITTARMLWDALT